MDDTLSLTKAVAEGCLTNFIAEEKACVSLCKKWEEQLSIYKLVALKNGQPFFEYPIPVNAKGDFAKGAADAFREFHKLFSDILDPEAEGISFIFDKA